MLCLLGLLPCNRLGTRPLDYIKEGRVPRRTSIIPWGTTSRRRVQYYTKQDVGYATLATQTCINLVSSVLAHTFEFPVWRSPTIYSPTGTPLWRLLDIELRQQGSEEI
jgi:hypothetical protein